MKIFSSFDKVKHTRSQHEPKKRGKKAISSPVREKRYSDEEIREMVAQKSKKTKFSKKAYIENLKKKSPPQNSEFMKLGKREVIQNPEEATSKASSLVDEEVKSNINKNDPNDSNTREKLKDILANGGFSFNDKESRVLSQILNNS